MSRGLTLVTTILVALVVTSCRGQTGIDVTPQPGTGIDVTRQPGTYGSDVVNAVVELIKASCIFSEDRLFLRRLAFVESTDGNDPDTYKAGYDGGIWKVSQAMLSATTSCPSAIRATCNTIQSEFHIDWTKVTWADLRKPLYSGLAASLYILNLLSSNISHIPATLAEQQNLWLQNYHVGTPTRNFITYVANATFFDCKDHIDVAFIVDSSGSITNADFALSLGFVADVVNALDVPNVVKVALVIFDSVTSVELNFNSSLSKAAIVSAIRGYRRTRNGGTNTALALETTRSTVFTPSSGARQDVKKVAVLITDGQSDSASQTSAQAELLRRQSGVVIFSIGVGGYDLIELRDIATEPKCTHVYTLPDFSAIQSIIYEIERSTCIAARYLVNSTVVTTDTTIVIVNGSLVIDVNCGIAYLYLSYTNPNPNPAFYSQMLTATDGHPAYVTTMTTSSGQPLYMTVIGTYLSSEAARLKNCTEFSATITKTDEATIKCEVNHECRECTNEEIIQNSRIRELINCNDFNRFELSNPCSIEGLKSGHMLYPYPYSPNMFIRCDFKARPYLTLCPDRMTFNAQTLTCGFNSGSGGNRIPLPSTYPNPCTPAHIQAAYYYFEYNPDKSLYIHCDLWGNAWLQPCPVLELWNQELLTCVAERPGGNHPAITTPAFHNPCTKAAIDAGQMFHPYPCDHTRFIHCDVDGNYWVQFCPGGMFFDPSAYICVVGDPQHGNHGCD